MLTLVCAASAWAIVICAFTSVVINLKKGTTYVQKMHKIPCSGCAFFTNDYRLKCTVHPIKACSEYAIGCIDFEPAKKVCPACNACPGSKLDKSRLMKIT